MKSLLASLALGAAVLAGPVAAQGLTDMTDPERAAFRQEVRDYLLQNPEVLVEAIAVLESRQAQAEQVRDQAMVLANADALFNSELDWVGGNPDGDVVLVEFLDYRCSYCRRAFEDVERLIADDGNIRFVVKEFPILGEQSTLASRFALSARMVAGDDAYKDVHDGLMVMRADVNHESLLRLAEGLGLDGEAILAGIDAPEISRVIDANHALAQQLSISGTPSFVMGEQLLRGYMPYEQMAALLARTRALTD